MSSGAWNGNSKILEYTYRTKRNVGNWSIFPAFPSKMSVCVCVNKAHPKFEFIPMWQTDKQQRTNKLAGDGSGSGSGRKENFVNFPCSFHIKSRFLFQSEFSWFCHSNESFWPCASPVCRLIHQIYCDCIFSDSNAKVSCLIGLHSKNVVWECDWAVCVSDCE